MKPREIDAKFIVGLQQKAETSGNQWKETNKKIVTFQESSAIVKYIRFQPRRCVYMSHLLSGKKVSDNGSAHEGHGLMKGLE